MSTTLPQLHAVTEAVKALQGKRPRVVDIAGPWGSAKTLIAVQTAKALGCSLLMVSPGRIEAEGVYDDLCAFAAPEQCVSFPAWEVLPSDIMAPADDIVAERLDALKKLAGACERGEIMYAAAPLRAVLQPVVNRLRLVGESVTMRVGEEHDLEELINRFVRMGYNRQLMVEQRGEMSVRGGIFDIFPISGELPYRVEFFGDEIESIRRFEPETQRSIDHVTELHILPRSEKNLITELQRTPAALTILTDYFPDNTLIVIDEPMAVVEEAGKLQNQFGESPFFMSYETATGKLAKYPRLLLAQVAHGAIENATRLTEPMRSLLTWEGHIEGFWQQVRQWEADKYAVVLMCNNTGERQRLLELLDERGFRPGQGTFDLRVEIGRLRAGFAAPKDRLAMLSEREMFGRHYVRRARRRFEAGATITSFSDLKSGDYIVHVDHGIGRYLGLRRFEGKSGDFLTLQYSGGDKLYLPASQVDSIQKFVGGDGVIPKIDKLGGATWARTKARVKRVLRDMTEELLKVYAARETQEGHAFSVDTHWQREFEDAFEYDETPDQARAIVDVKKDLESAKPMDRLICGDVGYGKTEVALRAAFKVVMDGKQAALLAPTTVLAQQHYATFSERLADYPVKVGVLSRFQTSAEVKTTIERMKSGEVDIVVGTHRLLSKDVKFKDLGLLIIDEEQRFGVGQKERLKQLRTLVDVMTLTATPIPRTLNMALMGVRDMSVISTAPNDRLPIHTCIEQFDEEHIKEAIRRELGRQGQVFFVHNRVQTIHQMAELVRKLVPDARIAVGHGQMNEHELAHVMEAFIRKEVDVLVCTTIIGSGVDIPNANTIIVNQADHFGLAELYQIRGRVGRYKHRAFAYLLVPGDRALSEDAQKRLKALEEFSTLGSGFSIAMRDLEIRGCGNILGGEQHGNVAAVGYDMYTQLIAETVAELRGQPIVRRILPPLDIASDAYIPEEYVPSEAQKMTLYKRISGARTTDEVDELRAELADRFGAPPLPVRRLLDIMHARALGADVRAKKMVISKDAIVFEFDNGHFLSRGGRNALTHAFGARMSFSWQERPGLTYALQGEDAEKALVIAERILKAMTDV